MATLSSILKDNRFTSADIPSFESSLFFEGERAQRYIVRFTILLFLSTVIATQGVIEDSTATPCGKCHHLLVAPT